MEQMFDLVKGVQFEPIALVDIFLTAVLIYGVFSLIQGTRAVRLVIGAIILYLIFVVAQELNLVLLSGIMRAGAVVGLLALVVVFQPELRSGLDRLGRVGTLRWLGASDETGYQHVADVVATSAATLSAQRVGALIVVERVTGLGDMTETGVTLNADLSKELLVSLFAPGYPLHDGAVIVSGEKIVAASVMLPLAERMTSELRYGTRHRAAVGVTEQTDALAIVVSEESGAISLAEAGAIVGTFAGAELRQRLLSLLNPAGMAQRARDIAARGSTEASAPASDAPEAEDADADPPAEGTASKTGKKSGASDASPQPRTAGSPE